MNTRTKHPNSQMREEKLKQALELLDFRLKESSVKECIELVVCGGSALILTGLVPRTTQDVDIVGL